MKIIIDIFKVIYVEYENYIFAASARKGDCKIKIYCTQIGKSIEIKQQIYIKAHK